MAAERTPIEIWHQIIREATRIPSWLLDGTLYDPLGPLKQIHPNQTYLLLFRLLSIKSSISLVCKCWRHICSAFLYESLLIRQEDTIPRLANKFQTIDMNIHKVFRIDFLRPSSGLTRPLPSASTLISLCPSLLVIAFHGSIWGTRDHVFKTIAKSPSIRCFEWHVCRQKLPKVLVSLLSNSPQTWSFFIDFRPESNNLTRFEDMDMVMSGKSSEEGTLLFTQEVPRINRHMVLGNYTDTDFLQYPNETIHSMSMSIITLHPYMLRTSSDFLSSLSPTVHTLIIYVNDIPASLSSIAYHVKRIGLNLGQSTAMPSPPELDHCFNILVGNNTPHLYFPSLRILQLNDPALATAMRIRPHQLRLWEHRCLSREILLYDESGNRFRTATCYPGVSNGPSKVRKTSKDPNLTNKRYQNWFF